ncbi:SIMPL domain-containing protein [Algoriphagus mannitolivorans]|uniref:SIMPL domain-containing protein n=1 Tax=Algoriphagus mannitolivorans TaxID=226504 RepID=UPI00040473C1|nr:SIMPL domain-containing protein [Algoriphagus mannitolivorans]
MKNILTLFLTLGIAQVLFAQQVQQVPIIEVEGYAERKLAPDEAVYIIQLEEKTLRVNNAVNTLNKKAQNLADALKKERIKDYKLIADNYSVDVNRIYRSGTAKDSGYVARQTLRIVTSPTNEDLQKISEAIQKSGDMSYNLQFGVAESTRKSLENTLLAEALKDAEARATLIGNTLNLKGLRVFYVGMEQSYVPQPKYLMNARSMAESADMVIQPDDHTISRRVYIKYTY